MKIYNTVAIVLKRIDYGEADRILFLLTPDHGKIRVLARGVRKIRSKLAGGIELFSISNISFIKGKSDLGTLTSSRLLEYYANIVKNMERTQTAYDLIRRLDRATEDNSESEYFELLKQGLVGLNDFSVSGELIESWFNMQLLRYGGHTPDLRTSHQNDNVSEVEGVYDFNFDQMRFLPSQTGRFTPNHIKLLRIGFTNNEPKNLQNIRDVDTWLADISPLLQTMLKTYIRL